MRLRPPALAVAWVLAAGALLPAAQDTPTPLKNALYDDDVKRLGERVRALQGPADAKLLETIQKLIEANPGVKPEQLAQKLLLQHPEFLRPENAAKLQGILNSLTGKAGPTPAGTPAPGQGGPVAPPPSTTPGPTPTPPVKPPVVAPPLVPPSPRPGPAQAGDPPAGPTDPPPTPAVPGSPATAGVGASTDQEPVDPRGNQPPYTPVPNPPTNVPPPPPPASTEQEAQFRAATGWWEKNVGPINDSPAVKEMLAEFIKGAGSADGQSPLSSILKDLKGDGPPGLKDWMKDALPKDLKLPKLDFGGGPKGLPNVPDLPSVGTPVTPSLDFGSLAQSWAPVYLFALAGVAAFAYFVAWPWWRGRAAGGVPTPVPGLGPWPVDPRAVTSRDALVKAFDYLSVLTLGAEARQYNHLTIAGELRRLVPAADDVADELGRHYAVARYTPPAEPIAAAEIAAARVALCRLAGVPA